MARSRLFLSDETSMKNLRVLSRRGTEDTLRVFLGSFEIRRARNLPKARAMERRRGENHYVTSRRAGTS